MGSKIIKTILFCLLPVLGYSQIGYRKTDTALVVTEGGKIQVWKTWDFMQNKLDQVRRDSGKEAIINVPPDADYIITRANAFVILPKNSDDTRRNIFFPNPANFEGERITLWLKGHFYDDAKWYPAGPYIPEDGTSGSFESGLGSLFSGRIIVFLSIDHKWICVNEKNSGG